MDQSKPIVARDPGLDLIRALGLFLMVGAHLSREIPTVGPTAAALKFLAEAAPAFFFFGFGMTFDRFMAKDRDFKIESSLLFLYVALAHSISRSYLFYWDFLAFLWTWRTALALIESVRPLRGRAGWLIFAALAAAVALLPRGMFYNLFNLWGETGAFPLLPWGGFVVAGLAWQRTDPRRRPWLLAAIGVAAAALIAAGFYPAKRPLNVSYLLSFTFICLALSEGARRMETAYRALPGLARGCEYLSLHLLPATVLHYVPVMLAAQLFRHGWLSALDGRETPALVAAWTLTFAALLGLLPASLWLWERVRMSPVAVRARGRIHILAPLLILLALVPAGNLSRAADWSYLPLHLPAAAVLALRLGCWALVMAAMLYFALESVELGRRARTTAATGAPDENSHEPLDRRSGSD